MYIAYIYLSWCVILHQENLELTRQALRAAKVRIHAYEQSLQVEYQKKYFEAFELIKRLLHEKVASLTLSVTIESLAFDVFSGGYTCTSTSIGYSIVYLCQPSN